MFNHWKKSSYGHENAFLHSKFSSTLAFIALRTLYILDDVKLGIRFYFNPWWELNCRALTYRKCLRLYKNSQKK